MGRHAKKRRWLPGWWLIPLLIAGAAALGVNALLAPSAPLSHHAPLPTFTSDPSYPVPQRPSQPSPEPSAVTYYTIVSGDTLAAVSLKYCHTADWTAIASRNHIGNPDAITPGEKITC
jgi:nucleoid-associated protein YgaU